MRLERMLVDTSTRTAWGKLSNGKKVQVGIDDISESFMRCDHNMSNAHFEAFSVMSDLVKDQVSE